MTGYGQLDDDGSHLAALLAVLALARADAVPDGTPLQAWRARRIAALSADLGSALPQPAGQRRALRVQNSPRTP
jgi:hypothetical protein